MPTWTLTLDDSFAHADTSAGSLPTTPAVGAPNGWLTTQSRARIHSNQCEISGGSDTVYRVSGENSVDQRVVSTFKFSGCVGSAWTVYLRYNPGGGNWYTISFFGGGTNGNANCYCAAYTGNTYNKTIFTPSFTGLYDATHDYQIDFSASGTNPTTLSFTLIDTTNGQTLAAGSGTDSTTALQTSGAIGFGGNPTTSPYTMDWTRIQGYVGALGGASITPGYSDATHARVSWSGANGGTAPYTYQLQRSTSADGTYANISGATTSPYDDAFGGAAGDYRYYKVVTTDSVAASVTSGACAVAIRQTPLNLGIIGDSILAGTGDGTSSTFYSALLGILGDRQVSVKNVAIGGTRTQDWQSGGANMTAALSAFSSAGVNVVSLMLGANDAATSNSVPTATYISRMQNIISTLTGAGYTVIVHSVHCPQSGGGGNSWDDTSLRLMKEYYDATPALCNGTTILQGDRQAYYLTMMNPSVMSDGLHYGPTSTQAPAICHALGYLGAIGGGGGVSRSRAQGV